MTVFVIILLFFKQLQFFMKSDLNNYILLGFIFKEALHVRLNLRCFIEHC